MSTTPEIGDVVAPSRLAGPRYSLRRLLSLSPQEASFPARGFAQDNPAKRVSLERIGETFIGGYNAAIRAKRQEDVLQYIYGVAPAHRGFAVEGAAMGCAVAEILPFRTPSLADHVQSVDREFSYLTHVGAGWALARVPWRRTKIMSVLDPVNYWLAYDGMGFHDSYFHHHRILAGWRRQRSGYAVRAYDQGVGRALWFVAGGSHGNAIALIRGFPPERRRDLWAGLGLAMAYAGPTDADEVAATLVAAGAYRAQFAQGVAFACEARVLARHVPMHTELAANVVSSAAADALSDLVRQARTELAEAEADHPPYEVWRGKVGAALSARLEARK